MRRPANILLYLSVLLLVGVAVYWFAWVSRHREFKVGADLHAALRVLNRVRLAESRCYTVKGQFVPLQDLGPGGCGAIEQTLSFGADDGFSVQVHANANSYTVRVHPIDGVRLHSLFLDQTGALHFGTRDSPATTDSPLLTPR